jgi:hypothetical protein
MTGRILSMTNTGLSRSRNVLLALLLAGTLLLCHGVFGALHLCSASQASASHAHEHNSPMDAGAGVQEEHAVCHLMDVAHYFAVFLAAILGLVLWLLLKGARLWGRVSAPFVFGLRLRPPVFHPPRGPTLPVLQVFRL